MTKEATKKPRGGRREGAGRKAADGVTHTVAVMVSLTESHREKLKALGGSLWLRAAIDQSYDSLFPKNT